MSDHKNLAETIFARMAAQRTGPLALSLVTQQAKAVYDEALLAARGSSEDVFARLEAASL